MSFAGHREKIYFVHFHPLAKDILASASYDMTVKIWNLATGEEVIELTGHTSQVSVVWGKIVYAFIYTRTKPGLFMNLK